MTAFKLQPLNPFSHPDLMGLTLTQKGAVYELGGADVTMPSGFVRMNKTELAARLGCSSKTAGTALATLEEKGLIVWFKEMNLVYSRWFFETQGALMGRELSKHYKRQIEANMQSIMQSISSFYGESVGNIMEKCSMVLETLRKFVKSALGYKRVSAPLDNRLIDINLSPPTPSHEPTQKMSLNDEREKYKKLEAEPVELHASDQPQVSVREIEKNSFYLSSPEPTQEPKADKAKGEMHGMKALMGQVLPSLFGGGGNPEPEPPQKPKKDAPPVADAPPTPLDKPLKPLGDNPMLQAMQERIKAMMDKDTPEKRAAREKRRLEMEATDKRAEEMKEKARWAAYAPFMKGDAKKCVWAMYKEYFGDSPGHRDCSILSGMADSFGQLDDEKKREFMDAFLNHGEKAKSLTYILSILRNDGFKIMVGDER